MKAFVLTKKNVAKCSHENYVVLAKDKNELEDICKTYPSISTGWDHKNLTKFFMVEEFSTAAVVYSDIY